MENQTAAALEALARMQGQPQGQLPTVGSLQAASQTAQAGTDPDLPLGWTVDGDTGNWVDGQGNMHVPFHDPAKENWMQKLNSVFRKDAEAKRPPKLTPTATATPEPDGISTTPSED